MTVVKRQPIAATRPEQGARAEPREFDGVICFGGEDWWYHNRGHYDMQMMRELSARVPVLFVNSLGMRVPRITEGAMFLRRIARKIRSLRRGLVAVNERFHVFSPLVMPGPLGVRVSGPLLPRQVRRAARRAGIRRPLVWISCPPAAAAVDALDPVAVIYQRTDRFEAFTGVDEARIREADRFLKQRADLTLFCSRSLFELERSACRRALFVDHGVDFDTFAAAGDAGDDIPADLASIPRPRVGFIGGLDRHTFDADLFDAVAGLLPDVRFVLVGACSLPDSWRPGRNVHLLGQRAYSEVARYMAGCDVLIMPWNDNEWIKVCNPVKLKEYLAVGRPIVSTPFDELARYQGLVRVVRTPELFARAIRDALSEPADTAAMRERVENETWTAKAEQILGEIVGLGFQPAGGGCIIQRAAPGRSAGAAV
ncbi:MAG: glycosyltransferase [Planctomycetes bacterium]|nr:glycosyltransferase [Planctomycetota bacterium]